MLTTALELLGALLIVVPIAFLVWPPLALIAAGVVLLLASYLLERRRDGDDK